MYKLAYGLYSFNHTYEWRTKGHEIVRTVGLILCIESPGSWGAYSASAQDTERGPSPLSANTLLA
jgi:hypothetical protein